MGLFDLFKKKTEIQHLSNAEEERLENFPEMLTAKLLFADRPNVDAEKILNELNHYFSNITAPGYSDNTLLFAFPGFQIELEDAKIPAQCFVGIPDKGSEMEIPQAALQQNWYWPGANEAAKNCKYELLVTDLMSRSLDYKQRLDLFMNFLTAVTKATRPDVVYAVNGEKLIDPSYLTAMWDGPEKQLLYGICNVRLYNISDSADKEVLMDTIGLNAIGLPDFQIKFSDFEPRKIAAKLWNYAYYIYDRGDVIENGNTVEGLVSGSKWKCERQVSQTQPQRVIINVVPN